ncbi:TPA: hypothetical protein P9F39_005389 [Pseudomonas aeruginosa]|nr:hypothetical protein [Pseudomonas aeruginosa]HEK0294904.1 hypothetical protein [Pseudomonas aeruginosa]
MPGKVLIIDTSILCCWLNIPGKETAGPRDDQWDQRRVETIIDAEEKNGSTFVLPIASLIETGNHIAQINGNRYDTAVIFAKYIRKTANAETPWAAFTEQSPLWETENLLRLSDTWPDLAATKLSIGDATIKDVAEYYASAGFNVEILTGDQGLKSYTPRNPPKSPRRRGG